MNGFKMNRELAGIKQSDAAKHLHVTQSAISQWENGLASPRSGLLLDMANLYRCTVGDLLSNSDITEARRASASQIPDAYDRPNLENA